MGWLAVLARWGYKWAPMWICPTCGLPKEWGKFDEMIMHPDAEVKAFYEWTESQGTPGKLDKTHVVLVKCPYCNRGRFWFHLHLSAIEGWIAKGKEVEIIAKPG